MAFAFIERWSPEHALNNVFDDIKASGLDGLKRHLTSNARKTVESFESITSRPEIALFTKPLMGGDAASVLLDKLSECEWTIKEMMKGAETSQATVRFNYQDKLIGTIQLTMIKENKIWVIDSLSKPRFDKSSLS